MFLCTAGLRLSSAFMGLNSVILPSLKCTIRCSILFRQAPDYALPLLQACPFATSFNISMTCMFVCVSRAPVGSSAKSMSGAVY